MLIAGRPVTTEFFAVDQRKLVAMVAQPGSVSEISFFLMPQFSLPPDKGLVIYFTTDGSSWSTLGALHSSKPSATFVTRWGSIPEVSQCASMQVGCAIESADVVQSVVALESQASWDKLNFAQLVARDLFTFLGSFSQNVPGLGERLVIPADGLSRWLSKFEERFRRDGANFLAKHAS